MWGAGVPGGAGSALCVTAPAPRQLFKGKFYYCEGADTRNISTRAECRAAHYRWVRRKYNFDNLGQVGGVRAGREGRVEGRPDLESFEVGAPVDLRCPRSGLLKDGDGRTPGLGSHGWVCSAGGLWGGLEQEAGW